MKKIIATVFSALIFLGAFAAENGFELKIYVQNPGVKPGESVKLIAEPIFPADYKPLYWKVYAKTKDKLYKVKYRIYELEEMLKLILYKDRNPFKNE